MALNFENLPKDKPTQGTQVEEGKYTAEVFEAKMVTSKTSGNEYLNVSFKLDKGGFVNENYFESDKPFLLYKLGQLLKACNVTLSGEGTLKDVAKVVKGKKVIVDVAINDNGYPCLDYTKDKNGIYPIDETSESNTLDADVTEAIETNFDDSDF